MPDSDQDFRDGNLSDDSGDHRVVDSDDEPHGPSTHKSKSKRKTDKQASWEQVKRSWDVEEGEDGTLIGLDHIDAEKRRRLLRDTTPLQRGIIRHVVLVLDMSLAMAAKDYLPTYFRSMLKTAREFVREYFEQNPISQLAIIGMRDGVAERISDMSGNPPEHLEKLKDLEAEEPKGSPSLQNALEMCRGALL